MLLAAAATAFFSCQKPEVIVPETSQEVILTFASEKPAFDDETKTEWNGETETIQWSEGDKISIAYTVNDIWQNASGDASGDAKLYKSDVLDAAAEIAQFNVSTDFKGTGEGIHMFYGVYPAPSSTSFADAPVASLTVPALQTPKANSFDGAADLMTGVSVKAFNSLAAAQAENISMKWTRLVAHANITLKALNGVTAGEKVTSISLTAQKGANLVGQQKVNLLTNEVANDNAASNVLELNGGNLSIDANGNVEFWACVLPETLTSLTVVVETDKATYTREITGISKTFKQNARNTLSVKMDAANRVAKDVVSWVLVTSEEELTEGTYVLVVKNTNTKNLTGALDSSNGSSAAPALNTSVQVNDNLLTGVGSSVQFDMTIVEGGYKFAVSGQTTNYLYTTSSNNGVRIGTNTNNIWTLTPDSDYPDAYTFKCNATSRYMGVYETTPDWRCYTSINDNIKERNSEIYLYKKVEGEVSPDRTPKIVVSGNTTKDVVFGGETVTFNYELKNLEAEELTWEVSNSDMISSVNAENGVLTVTVAKNEGDARTATITLSCGDANDVVLTINQGAYVDPTVINEVTITEFLAATVSDVKYKLTGVIEGIYNTTYGNFYLNDGTTKVLVYGLTATEQQSNDQSFASLGLRDGDELTLIGKRADYNGTPQVGGPAYYVSHISLCATPSISFENNTVTITAEEGATIHYTTDGTEPTTTSAVYSAAITVTEANSPMTIKAIAVAEGKLQSYVASRDCEWKDPNAGVTAKTYTFTITPSDFNSKSYAENNNEKTSIATASDGSTMEVKWTSYQLMFQNQGIQWQKSKGYIYNSTDLGTIDEIKITSSAGTFTQYVGTSKQPTAAGSGGYFQIKVGSATGNTSEIKITFKK